MGSRAVYAGLDACRIGYRTDFRVLGRRGAAEVRSVGWRYRRADRFPGNMCDTEPESGSAGGLPARRRMRRREVGGCPNGIGGGGRGGVNSPGGEEADCLSAVDFRPAEGVAR